jgi:hypothetical protein
MGKSYSEFDNSSDVIDSRDVIARREELEGELEALRDAEDAADAETVQDVRSAKLKVVRAAMREWEDEHGDELKALVELCDEGEGYGDWEHGETLVRDSHFRDFAEQLAEDIGAVKHGMQWPMNHIDWDAAAEALQQVDYHQVDFDGVTYWVRA